MLYDYCIVGGGLAGLYTAFRLEQQEPNANIIILERNRQLGGRIDTIDGVEAGAGRFHDKQHRINQLVNELGLHKKPIDKFGFFIPSGQHMLYNWNQIDEIMQRIVHRPNIPRDITFLQFAKSVVSSTDTDILVDFYGYTFDNMNAHDTANMIRMHFTKNQYYTLDGGMYQLIQGLVQQLKATTRTHMRVNSIEYNSNFMNVRCDDGSLYTSKRCICAVPATTLRRWSIFKPIFPLLRNIKSLPLCRIYARIPNLPNKSVTTDNNLRIVIPIHDDVVMMSYTDGHRATQWKRLLDDKGIMAVNREHKRLLESIYGISVRMPTHTKIYYWKDGVAYFGTGFDSRTMPRKIMHPLPGVPLYVCGENYSATNYQWMEGALDTSDYILGIL